MLPPTADATSPVPGGSGKRPGRILLPFVLVICAVMVVAGVLGYGLYRQGPAAPLVNIPPHATEFLANGSTLLDVPLMAFYTPAAPQTKGFDTNLSWAVSSATAGPNSTFDFRWNGVSGISGPVRFVLVPRSGPSTSTAFRQGDVNGFQAMLAGSSSEPGARQAWAIGMSGPGIQDVYHERWLLNYTVSRISATTASVEERWIQVNYSLVSWGAYGEPLPAANTSLPTGADLISLGDVLEENISQGITIAELEDAHTDLASLGPFRHTLPPIVLLAGRAGNLSVSLTSEFHWGPADGYWLGWSLTAQKDITLRVRHSVDARFGTFIVEFLP